MTLAKPKKISWWREDDYVIAAWAEYCSGPGWSNTPVWVLVKGADGQHRVECLQPNEHSLEVSALFPASAAVANSMLGAVRSDLHSRGHKGVYGK